VGLEDASVTRLKLIEYIPHDLVLTLEEIKSHLSPIDNYAEYRKIKTIIPCIPLLRKLPPSLCLINSNINGSGCIAGLDVYVRCHARLYRRRKRSSELIETTTDCKYYLRCQPLELL